jgi:hypothetical protein
VATGDARQRASRSHVGFFGGRSESLTAPRLFGRIAGAARLNSRSRRRFGRTPRLTGHPRQPFPYRERLIPTRYPVNIDCLRSPRCAGLSFREGERRPRLLRQPAPFCASPNGECQLGSQLTDGRVSGTSIFVASLCRKIPQRFAHQFSCCDRLFALIAI